MEKPTKAKDFPLEMNAKGFVGMSKMFLDKSSLELLIDCLRGLSFKMQYIMCMRIMDYFYFGEIVPTGVKHVDAMIKELITKYPFDHRFLKFFYKLEN